MPESNSDYKMKTRNPSRIAAPRERAASLEAIGLIRFAPPPYSTIIISLVRPKPTAYGRATLTGSAVPASLS
jgi:hypothetical protein